METPAKSRPRPVGRPTKIRNQIHESDLEDDLDNAYKMETPAKSRPRPVGRPAKIRNQIHESDLEGDLDNAYHPINTGFVKASEAPQQSNKDEPNHRYFMRQLKSKNPVDQTHQQNIWVANTQTDGIKTNGGFALYWWFNSQGSSKFIYDLFATFMVWSFLYLIFIIIFIKLEALERSNLLSSNTNQ
jgi:hypothetical protein